jgi:hypothetical protein
MTETLLRYKTIIEKKKLIGTTFIFVVFHFGFRQKVLVITQI